MARAGHPHQCRRRIPGREVEGAQHGHGRRVAALRRPARVDAQRGGRLPGRRRRERLRPGAHRRGARRAAQRHRRGPALGRRADGVQVDGDRRRGPRSGAALRRPGARARRRRRGRRSDPARRDRGCPRAHRRRRPAHAADPAADAGVSGRDLAQARVPAADQLVQDPRRRQRDPLGTGRRGRPRGADDERRQHGPGRRLDGPRAGRARHRRRAGARAADQARRDRAPRRHRDQGAVRALVADDGGGLVPGRRRATSSTPCSTTR